MRDSDLPAPSKHLALTLGTHTGRKCRRPFVSIGTLVRETSLGRSTVLKHLKKLTEEDRRFVRKERRRDAAGRTTSNEYRLVVPTGEGRVHEIDPPVQEIDPRGSSRWTGEGPANGPEGSKNEGSNKKDTEKSAEDRFVSEAWAVFLEELGGNGRQPQLLEGREKKLRLLYAEQLQHEDDPVQGFRRILRQVQASDHHMSNRDFQMPESLFRNAKRRERWTLKALDGTSPGTSGSADRRQALDAIEQRGRGE